MIEISTKYFILKKEKNCLIFSYDFSKDGLRGKFRDLINRKKSEACIREYEKNLSKSYQLKECETALLYVIEAWKEFRTFVLLCYLMNSGKGFENNYLIYNN